MCHCKVEVGRWRWGGGKRLKKKNAPAGKYPYGLIYRKVRPLFILFFCVALLVVVTTSAPRGDGSMAWWMTNGGQDALGMVGTGGPGPGMEISGELQSWGDCLPGSSMPSSPQSWDFC